MHRGPPISTDEWEEKKILFDEKTGRTWPQIAKISAVAMATRECVLKQVWALYVRDEFDLISAIQTHAELSYAMQSWTKSEVGKKEKREKKNKICSEFAASMWICT